LSGVEWSGTEWSGVEWSGVWPSLLTALLPLGPTALHIARAKLGEWRARGPQGEGGGEGDETVSFFKRLCVGRLGLGLFDSKRKVSCSVQERPRPSRQRPGDAVPGIETRELPDHRPRPPPGRLAPPRPPFLEHLHAPPLRSPKQRPDKRWLPILRAGCSPGLVRGFPNRWKQPTLSQAGGSILTSVPGPWRRDSGFPVVWARSQRL
jgi:hypothetical protein